jgi:8-oxo-dGTP pyrophosphatase MutT (NUDIX family)
MENPESVVGIVFSPDRLSVLLILRRDVPVWVLPGGGIDLQETAELATVREILEETGLTVKIDRLIGHYYPINRLTKKTVVYECTKIDGDLTTSNETKGVKFILLDALPPMPPPYLEWIEDAKVKQAPLSKKIESVTYPKLLLQLFLHPILVIRFLLARLGLSINS